MSPLLCVLTSLGVSDKFQVQGFPHHPGGFRVFTDLWWTLSLVCGLRVDRDFMGYFSLSLESNLDMIGCKPRRHPSKGK